MLAGIVAPAEATWAALMVLYAACLQYGVPEPLVSDGGGAYISTAFEAVCQRLAIDHNGIVTGDAVLAREGAPEAGSAGVSRFLMIRCNDVRGILSACAISRCDFPSANILRTRCSVTSALIGSPLPMRVYKEYQRWTSCDH
jgi:hypothetical protein